MLNAFRRRSEGDIEMDHIAVLYQTRNWIALSEGMIRLWAFKNVIMNLRLYNVRNFPVISISFSLSRKNKMAFVFYI